MAALDFPSSPTNGQEYTQNGIKYYYDATSSGWLTTYVTSLNFANVGDTQVVFVDNSQANGSSNLTFNKTLGSLNVKAIFIDGSPPGVIGNETANTSTYYPIFTSLTGGVSTFANVANTKLYFVPGQGTLSATAFASLSDITLKTDIENFDDEHLLEGIHPVTFRWKDTGSQSYGVIAQELEQTIPELVVTNENGIKSVSYIPMISILINTVKRQQTEIENLKMRVERLENNG